MRGFALALVFGFVISVCAAQESEISKVDAIFNEYLAAEHPKRPTEPAGYDRKIDGEISRARQSRLSILAELEAFPEEAVLAARRVLFEQASSQQRYEIVGSLGSRIQTRECADLLHDVLQDLRKPDDERGAVRENLVRSSAVSALGRMGMRTHRSGGRRIKRVPDSEPKVQGLMPYIILGANDHAEHVRMIALYALANSRDPAAVVALRNRLKDSSAKVRLRAACFLTEYQDASGLPEMRTALFRLKNIDLGRGSDPWEEYLEVGMLLASFERITGKGFGKIPMNPSNSSSLDRAETDRHTYKDMLNNWHAWWTWQPE